MPGDGTKSSRDDYEANGDESNNGDHSNGYQGSTSDRFGTPKFIIFDEYGRPVDIESEKFATAIGKITKTHCPPAIDFWKKVPESMKADIWRDVNKKESPTGEVNRSVLYVTTHMPMNTNSSTSSNDYVEKIRKLVEDDPYLGQNNLDNDPVAMVLGRDKKGYVRGMGGGVSKIEIRASAASREIARQLKNKNEAMETDLITLKEEMATVKEILKNNPPRTIHHQSSSSVHSTSEVPEQSNLPMTYFLKYFKKKHVIFGRLNSDTPPKEVVYSIIVDEIFDGSAYLFEGDGKFEDIMLGDVIN